MSESLVKLKMFWMKSKGVPWAEPTGDPSRNYLANSFRFSASSSILIFFSALFREVHNQRKRELKLPFAASQRAAFPLPISLQCDVTGSPNLITLRLIIHYGEWHKCAILLLMLQHCSLTLLPPHGCEILHEEDFFVISQHINHSTLCTDVLSVPPSNLCHSQSTNYHLAIMMTWMILAVLNWAMLCIAKNQYRLVVSPRYAINVPPWDETEIHFYS